MNPYRLRAYFLLLIVSAIWGVAGPVIKFTLSGLSTLPFLTYRFFLSSIAAVLISGLTKSRIFPSKKYFWQGLLYGFLTSTVALSFLFLGLEKTTVLDMTFINLVNPLLIAIAGSILLNEHITKRERLGMGIAFFGSFITVFQPLFENVKDLHQTSGNILIIIYLLVNTTSVILMKKLVRKKVSPITLTNSSFIIGFFTILPIAFGVNPNFIFEITDLSLPYHLGVIFMALLSGNLAYTFWIKAQKNIEVSEAALFIYLYPLFSTPLAIFWLKEKITYPFILGAILIVLGVSIAEYKKRISN